MTSAALPDQTELFDSPFEDKDLDSSALVAPAPHSSDSPLALKKIWLKNYKSFKELTVELGGFNVMVGLNNAGKTSLLQSIDLLYSLLKIHNEGTRLSGADHGKLVPTSILPIAAVKDIFYQGSWRLKGNKLVTAVIGAEFSDGSQVEFSLRYLFAGINSRVSHQSGMDGGRLAAILARPAVWVPSVVGIVRDEEFRTTARLAGLINTGRQNEVLRNMITVIQRDQPEKYKLLQKILQERFGAKFGKVSFDNSIDEFITAEYADTSGNRHDLYSAGSGFIQVVQLLAFVLSRDPGVVLLDEPDAHLHSNLQQAVVDLLEEIAASEKFQVVLATHSKEIINYVDPSRLVLIEKGSNTASPMSDTITPITVLRSLGSVDNVDAYTMVKNRKCLFVEGPTDESILGRFASTMGVKAMVGDDRVVTIPVHGADKFEHIQQLDVIEGLLGKTVVSIEIRDRDARTDESRSSLEASSKRTLRVLTLDCIESYLVNAEILSRVTNQIMGERGKSEDSTPEAIQGFIDAACEEMKDDTLDRISDRHIKDSRQQGPPPPTVPQANKIARETLGLAWSSDIDKLKYVYGKGLLAKVCKQVQETYGVNFGNERIAEAFKSEELPEELKGYITEISNLNPA